MVKIFVLHVKKGYEDRERHINQMMKNFALDFEYILDADICDFTDEIINNYFDQSNYKFLNSQLSCSLKHILAYQKIVDNNLDGAIILEDDMVLYSNFKDIFSKILLEIQDKKLDDCFVSLEDSNLCFVPRSQRKKNQFLYLQTKDRFAGAYYISNKCAKNIMNYIHEKKCDLPIDMFHKQLISRINLKYYWSHPCIATQGTHNGLFASAVNPKAQKKQKYRKLTWKLKLNYKKFLSFLR